VEPLAECLEVPNGSVLMSKLTFRQKWGSIVWTQERETEAERRTEDGISFKLVIEHRQRFQGNGQ
jgi:hypothetical protein